MGSLLDSLAAAFEAFPQRHDALARARRNALDVALQGGLPLRDEAWRYTPLAGLARREFTIGGDPVTLDAGVVAAIPAPRLVFVNGQFAASLSDLGGLPDGVRLGRFADELADPDSRVASVLERHHEGAAAAFARLNAALADDGAVLLADEGVVVEHPLHLVFIGAPTAGDRAWHLRQFIELRRGARLGVVEHHLDAAAHAHLANHLAHLHVAAGAHLDRLVLHHGSGTHMLQDDAVLAREAGLRQWLLALGPGLLRQQVNVRLEGRHAHVQAHGVLLGQGRAHHDVRLDVEHIAGDTTSRMTWRGLAAGRAREALHGAIRIRAGADGSDAELSCKGLLLGADAEFDAQPVLEILADEVKAAHGASVGQLDPAALFYLRSRGLPIAEARALLTAAFCREAVAATDGLLPAIAGAALDATLATVPAGPHA